MACLLVLWSVACASTIDMSPRPLFTSRAHAVGLAKAVSIHPHPSKEGRCWGKATLFEVYRNSEWRPSDLITIHNVDCCVSEGDWLIVTISDLVPPHDRVGAFRSESSSCLVSVDFCSWVRWFREGMPTVELTHISEDATCSVLSSPLGEWRAEEPPIPDLPEFSLEQGYRWTHGHRMPEGWTPPPEEPLTLDGEDASGLERDQADPEARSPDQPRPPARPPDTDGEARRVP